MLTQEQIDLIILITAPGDNIDRTLKGYDVQGLYPSVVKLLNVEVE
jgi:hypothetical protein